MRVMDVLREGEGAGSGGGDGAGAGGGGNDADFYKAEAKKAFDARDKAKEALRVAQESGRLLTDDQIAKYKALEAAATQAEEDRKKKAGEFDSLRVDLLKKHEAELSERDKKVLAATERLHGTLKDNAFASASEWFGKDAKTILTPAIAAAYFGRYVVVEADDTGAERVVVKGLDGHTILDAKTGKPADFTKAVGELIGMLPDKDSILRGSGKTGSGSSGGAGGSNQTTDLTELTKRARSGDKTAIEALRQQQASQGGIRMGSGMRRAS